MNGKFSVIMPLYNKATHVKRAVQSVLDQTCDDLELIVIDDGSTDGGGEVVRLFNDPRMSLVRQDNAGVSVARNRGIGLAKGELVAFLDADDSWERDFLMTIGRLRDNFPQAGLYATAYNIVWPNGQVLRGKFRAIPEPPWEGIMPSYFKSATLGDPPIWTSAVAIPRKILSKVGGFLAGKRMGEDLDLWGRIALQYPVAFSSWVGATYHRDAENRACLKFEHGDEHFFCETVKSLRKNGQIGPFYDDYVDHYLMKLRVENIRQFVLVKEYKRAIALASEIDSSSFFWKKLIWGSWLNKITYYIWKVFHFTKKITR
jgi:glycosyltransferase involved in cell wall biosynthesis